MRGALRANKANCVLAENTQEAAKGAQKTATENYGLAATTLVDLMTSMVDMSAGALGKKTVLGKQAPNISKQLNDFRGSAGSDAQTS